MGILLALISPFAYLKFRHSLKLAVDVYAPAFFAIAFGLAGLWGSLNLFGSSGVVTGINGLLQIVAGFFITSLAAIATFNGTIYRIDDIFEGEAALLDGEPLTRRQFLCHLFAYLAISSVMLYLVGVIGLASSSALHTSISGIPRLLLRAVFLAGYSAVFGHVFGTTMIGLIFLSARFTRVSPRDRFAVRARTEVPPAVEQSDDF